MNNSTMNQNEKPKQASAQQEDESFVPGIPVEEPKQQETPGVNFPGNAAVQEGDELEQMYQNDAPPKQEPSEVPDETQDIAYSIKDYIGLLIKRLEIQIGLVLAILAFFIVYFVGIISGVSFLKMLWSGFVFPIVFFIGGFGLVFIARLVAPSAFSDGPFPKLERRKSFEATVDDDLTDYGTNPSDLSREMAARERSGHNIDNEVDLKQQMSDNDPKEMARAIQTVMSRDQD